MPALENPRLESYALHRAKGFSPLGAAAAAGFVSGAHAVLSAEPLPQVRARVGELIVEIRERRIAAYRAQQELVSEVVDESSCDALWIINQLRELNELAKEQGDLRTSLDALRLISEIS